MSQHNERNPHTVQIAIGALAAGASAEVVGIKLPRNAIILAAALIDSAAIAADAVNFVDVKLRDHTGAATLAELTTKPAVAGTVDKGALAAYEGLDLLLTPTPSDALAGGPNSGGPGVVETVADRGHSLSVQVSSPGASTAVLTKAVLSLVLHYL